MVLVTTLCLMKILVWQSCYVLCHLQGKWLQDQIASPTACCNTYQRDHWKLFFLNSVWTEGQLLVQWKVAAIIPLSQQCKKTSNATSYRPIVPARRLDKTFKCMVNNHVMYFLENVLANIAVSSELDTQQRTTPCVWRQQLGKPLSESSIVYFFLPSEDIRYHTAI